VTPTRLADSRNTVAIDAEDSDNEDTPSLWHRIIPIVETVDSSDEDLPHEVPVVSPTLPIKSQVRFARTLQTAVQSILQRVPTPSQSLSTPNSSPRYTKASRDPPDIPIYNPGDTSDTYFSHCTYCQRCSMAGNTVR
jgi:hypothetical protein